MVSAADPPYYCYTGSRQPLVFDPMQAEFPDVGQLFQVGALSPNLAQAFTRSAVIDINVEIPLYNPQIAQFQGDSAGREYLPENWVSDSDSA